MSKLIAILQGSWQSPDGIPERGFMNPARWDFFP